MHYDIFNPDHEIALAMNTRRFVPSRNVRQMCHDLAFIPALWADDGDYVIVEDVAKAERDYADMPLSKRSKVCFISINDVATRITADDTIRPWGWNMAIREKFLAAGLPAAMLPSDECLHEWRSMSGRSLAVMVLEEQGATGNTVGTSVVCEDICIAEDFLKLHHDIVIKAPYSSSGRGVRYVSGCIDDATQNWILRTIKQQGYVTVEKKYDKQLDFAVEYEISSSGKLQRLGLSMFQTNGTAYTGNILASEDEKWNILARYLPKDTIEHAFRSLEQSLTHHLQGKYCGPFGVDMMIVRDKHGISLHPCVEINLRRTMGHVALSLSQRGEHGIMHTVFADGRFGMKIDKA